MFAYQETLSTFYSDIIHYWPLEGISQNNDITTLFIYGKDSLGY